MSQGKVYLIPTTLGENNPMEVLPITIKEVILQLRHFIVENEKTARRFIKKIAPELPQSELQFELINKFTEAHQIPAYLTPCMEGVSVGVISEAGCPGIADPGAEVVKTAHDKNLEVVPLVAVSYTHLRAHETEADLVCRLLLEKNFFNDTATTEIYT